MRFIIFVSVLICLFTIVLYKRFEKKIPSFGLRCLYDHEISGEKVSTFHYVIATLSFIPLIGVLLGIITSVFGFFTKKKGGGIVTVIGISGVVFMFFWKDFGFIKVMDQSKANAVSDVVEQITAEGGGIRVLNRNEVAAIFDAIKKADSNVIELNYTVEFLESFKEQTGNYPTVIANNNKESTYYELVDPEHYYLLSLGKDKIPFTADDIIPNIKLIKKKKTGLLIKPIKKNL